MAATQTINPSGLQIIRHFEQLHDGDLHKIGLQPKACPAGWMTVGYGHVVVDPKTGKRLHRDKPGEAARARELYPAMTIAEAEALLAEDCKPRERTVMRRINMPLNPNQFAALVSMEYNCGAISSNSTLVRLLNQGRFAAAAEEFLRWNKATVNGKRIVLNGLTRRRKSERELFLTGKVNFFTT